MATGNAPVILAPNGLMTLCNLSPIVRSIFVWCHPISQRCRGGDDNEPATTDADDNLASRAESCSHRILQLNSSFELCCFSVLQLGNVPGRRSRDYKMCLHLFFFNVQTVSTTLFLKLEAVDDLCATSRCECCCDCLRSYTVQNFVNLVFCDTVPRPKRTPAFNSTYCFCLNHSLC